MLIILGGRPGSGKTSLARMLAAQLGAMHLRVDTIEQTLLRSLGNIGGAGYGVAQALAADNLRLGLSVIADSVNPVEASRTGWRNVARETQVPSVEIEVICSDAGVHRRRVEARVADIAGHRLPRWADVQALHYEPWAADLVIDTARAAIEDIAAGLAARLSGN